MSPENAAVSLFLSPADAAVSLSPSPPSSFPKYRAAAAVDDLGKKEEVDFPSDYSIARSDFVA